jgi:alpha-ketoglutarate-dependent 2,4-dichlorophenoxyacetate dioxygenase
MKPTVTPLHSRFVAKITDIDAGNPIDQDIRRAIERAMDEYAICVLPGQRLADEEQIAFSRLFGSLDSPRLRIGGHKRRIEHKEIFDISNLDENGGILGEKDARASVRLVTQRWHTDGASLQESASWSMLHARTIPSAGGDTEFADTRAAYDGLTEAMKRRLEGLIAEHSLWHAVAKAGHYMPTGEEREAYPPARHPVVRRHPGSGRNALYIAATASHIVGMPVEDGEALLTELIDFATQPRFVYRHMWHAGDLVIWDNRCTMHRATPFEATDHVRDMRRTTIIDTAADVLVA